MDQGPLVNEEIDAGLKLALGFNEYQPVKAAFWLKAVDEQNRFLYIVSEQINDENYDVAYGEVLRLAGKIRSPYLDPFRVKIVNAEDPLAKAAVEINERFPGQIATRFRGKYFGDTGIDDVYIYASPLPATPT